MANPRKRCFVQFEFLLVRYDCATLSQVHFACQTNKLIIFEQNLITHSVNGISNLPDHLPVDRVRRLPLFPDLHSFAELDQ